MTLFRSRRAPGDVSGSACGRSVKKGLAALLLFAAFGFTARQDEEMHLLRRAEKIHDRLISIDTHTDTALELIRDTVNLSKVQGDFAKLRAGRVDCCFYPIFVEQGPLDEKSRQEAYAWALDKMAAIRAISRMGRSAPSRQVAVWCR